MQRGGLRGLQRDVSERVLLGLDVHDPKRERVRGEWRLVHRVRAQRRRVFGVGQLYVRRWRPLRAGSGVRGRRVHLQSGWVSQRLLFEQRVHHALGDGVWSERRSVRIVRVERRWVFSVGAVHVRRRAGVWAGPALREWKLRL
jgi:hypothetical protein